MSHDDEHDHPPDEHPPEHPEEEEEEHEPDEGHETVGKVLDTTNKTIGAVNKAIEGDGLAAAGGGIAAGVGVLETAAGAVDDEQTAEVLEGAAAVLEIAEKAWEAGEGLAEMTQHGSHGGGEHASETDHARHGQLGRSGDHAQEALEHLAGQSTNVHYDLTIEGVDDAIRVRSMHYTDGVSEIPSCFVEFACEPHTIEEETELFDKEAQLTIDRGEDQRVFKGLIRRASISNAREEQRIEIDIVPAAWLLSQTQDSRIYQDMLVSEVVIAIFDEYLSDRNRTVRLELASDWYQEHEYLVQYRESHYEFIERLCHEEGIWLYFDHDAEKEDKEVLVLCDSNENRPVITGGDDGRIEYAEHDGAQAMDEVAFDFGRSRAMGPTDAVVTDYDWTNPPLNVLAEETGRGDNRGPALETHEHLSATRFHGYEEGGSQYGDNDVQHHALMMAQRHDLNRQFWHCSTSVVGVQPGHYFELTGADDHDGRYLILKVSAAGRGGGAAGGYAATLELVPIDVNYIPPAPERPTALGPETATVVGDQGEEITVDKHGRVKVQFHWDRRGQMDQHSSVWIRVSQGWAGPGWGQMFIPRHGTEVIVSFLGGDPDRPVITGRLYNGTHPVPYPLPEHKTRSTIMTNSSPNKNGFNELRFEDKAGEEEVYIHAEKDFNEEVKNCHSTHVGVDQSNTVDRDQTETVKQNQTLHVEGDREKTVDCNETTTVNKNRNEKVLGDETIKIEGSRKETVLKDEIVSIDGARTITVDSGINKEIYNSGRRVIVKGSDKLVVADGAHWDQHVTGHYAVRVDGDHFRVVQNDTNSVELSDKFTATTTGDVTVRNDGGFVRITPGGEMVISANQKITISVGSSAITISSSEIKIEGPQVKIAATSGNTEIDASGLVKLKG